MTNEQSSELAEPGVGSFDDPAAFVAAQLAAIFIAPVPAVASVGHDQLDAAFLQPLAQWVRVIHAGLGSMPVDAVTPQQITRWMTKAQREHGWMPATANRYKAFISLSFRLGVENGKCSSNPARLVRRLRENNERIRFLTEEEETRLRKAIKENFEGRIADLDIALNTGMRQAEQYNLDWKDVDLIARRVTLRRTKNGSVRHIPLNQAAWSAFQFLWEKSAGEGRVFFNTHGDDPLLNPHTGGTLLSMKQSL
jgi:integrase